MHPTLDRHGAGMPHGRMPPTTASYVLSSRHDRQALHAHRLRGPARCATPSLTQKRGNILEKQVKDVYNNSARLKELMTASPMTAAQHAAINRKRIHDRRMLEDARERRSNANELF
ncbi:hypothetical protein [Noviherbaspirillum suwonense]|jgi:hypothetical protein|uniref:hypothetical protein n=1 Tax=Noviherbaspirillum suwonense TaxID=1224511 RepID=UPI0024B69753|nr:hypothetical protein [Noviherbaspirillum suwonense]